ncbi:MAG: hypothetical protein RL757_1102 [Bacteroidota bacterium]|jgi:uncharacterized membrane protein
MTLCQKKMILTVLYWGVSIFENFQHKIWTIKKISTQNMKNVLFLNKNFSFFKK